MKFENLKFWKPRTPKTTLTPEEWAEKVWADIQTPLITRVLREAHENAKK